MSIKIALLNNTVNQFYFFVYQETVDNPINLHFTMSGSTIPHSVAHVMCRTTIDYSQFQPQRPVQQPFPQTHLWQQLSPSFLNGSSNYYFRWHLQTATCRGCWTFFRMSIGSFEEPSSALAIPVCMS